MSIIFENEGSIDPRAITTFGLNAKDDSRNPIGYFGTGLKYAIAVLLRYGQGVVIQTGGRVNTFTLIPAEVRGKSFQLVAMNGKEMGFTTELGKNWELWMAYRELRCNAMDEPGGTVYYGEEAEREGLTRVIVDGEEIEEVHQNREIYFIEPGRQPRIVLPEIEVYNGSSDFVFYRGIRAGRVPGAERSRFTYNILELMTLTEDRTLRSSWEVERCIRNLILKTEDVGFLTAALTEKGEETLEKKLDYDCSYVEAGEGFISAVGRLLKTKSGKLNQKALTKFSKQTKMEIAPPGRSATEVEQQTISTARRFAEDIGFPTGEFEIRVANDLGDGVLALAIMNEGVIMLSAELVRDGVRHTAQAIIEESVHLKHRFPDESRGMQRFLFAELVRLGEKLVGGI